MEVYIAVGVDSGGTDILKVFDCEAKAKDYVGDMDNPDLDGYTFVTYLKRCVE